MGGLPRIISLGTINQKLRFVKSEKLSFLKMEEFLHHFLKKGGSQLFLC